MFLVLAIAALVAGCDAFGAPPVSQPTAPDAQCGPAEVAGGGIDGIVTDADGNPLDDILVIIDAGGGFHGSVRTAADGVFRAPDVSGTFTIKTVDAGHQPLVRTVTVPCGVLLPVELVLAPTDG